MHNITVLNFHSIIIIIIGEDGCFYDSNVLTINGTMTRADYNPAKHYHNIPGGCKIANGIGIAVLISVLLTIASVIARNKAIEINTLSLIKSTDDVLENPVK